MLCSVPNGRNGAKSMVYRLILRCRQFTVSLSRTGKLNAVYGCYSIQVLMILLTVYAGERTERRIDRTRIIDCSGTFPNGAQKKVQKDKIYGTRDSRMVTHCSTNLAITCLTRAERTGSRAFMFL